MTLPSKRRRRRPLPSAETIAGNEDLITEILIRLPAKSLCRFKCVSKQWYSLISRPNFSLLRIPKSLFGFFLGTRYYRLYKYLHLSGKRPKSAPFKYLDFVRDPNKEGIKIIHSCNGLFLCASGDYSREHRYHSCSHNFYVYNPTTKQFATIPRPCNTREQAVGAMNLAFDLSTAPHYKIVVVLSSKDPNIQSSWTNRVKIYSSETRAWKLSGKPFTLPNFQHLGNGVFCNGNMHWFSTRSDYYLYVDDNPWLRFDVDRGSFETFPKPAVDIGNYKTYIGYFGESRGHLHLICGVTNNYSSPFDVLEMESDYSKWFVKYHVHLDAIPTIFPEITSFYQRSILLIVREEPEEESYLLLYISGRAVSYNLKDKTFRKLCSLAKYKEWYHGWLDVHPYIETLFRVC